jgi:hypothetical protein
VLAGARGHYTIRQAGRRCPGVACLLPALRLL